MTARTLLYTNLRVDIMKDYEGEEVAVVGGLEGQIE